MHVYTVHDTCVILCAFLREPVKETDVQTASPPPRRSFLFVDIQYKVFAALHSTQLHKPIIKRDFYKVSTIYNKHIIQITRSKHLQG